MNPLPPKILEHRPPEHLQNKPAYPAKIDVWALGLCFYALFTERPFPWHQKKEEKQIKIITSLKADWARKELEPYHLPPIAADIINLMLHPDPYKRIFAAHALARLREDSQYQQPVAL